MDWLASQVIEALKGNIQDAAYIEGKKAEMEGLNRFEVALKITNLDSKNLESLAARLGVNVEDLRAFCRVIQAM